VPQVASAEGDTGNNVEVCVCVCVCVRERVCLYE
jgi:hypothetical protein